MKGQESAYILPQKEERRPEESWVLGVGGKLHKYSKQRDSVPALFSNLFICNTNVYNISVSSSDFHRLMEKEI